MIHLGKTDIDSIMLSFPTEAVLDVFAQLTEPLIDRIVANAAESRTLAVLRDKLLPKLVSGELRV